jgi:hypothetical protein
LANHDDDNSASPAELFFISAAAIPVLGAVISAPLVGFTLVTLAILDSAIVLFTGGTY